MRRYFVIDYPDELGPLWMNQDNLMLCINSYCGNHDGRIKATDVTPEDFSCCDSSGKKVRVLRL